jgi:hypothetical protein
VGKGCIIGKVVDAYDIDIWVGERCAKKVAANTSKTIDSDINHCKTSSRK